MNGTTGSARHLRHAAGGAELGPAMRRQAARLRAEASSDAQPRDRAAGDATVLAAWLSPEQRARYAPSLRAGGDLEAFVARLAEERRVVIEEGPDPMGDEIAEAARAEGEARQTPLRVLEGVAVGVLVLLVVLAVVLPLRSSPTPQELAWTVGPLVAGALLALVVAAVSASLAVHRRSQHMLDWATARPGQLGRGIPVRHPLQRAAAPTELAISLFLGMLLVASVLSVFVGAALLLVDLLLREGLLGMGATITLFVAGAVGLGVFVALSALRSRRTELLLRRGAAVEWMGADEDGWD